MSISLPNNKAEKWLRLDMLVKQGSITQAESLLAYIEYCRLFSKAQDETKCPCKMLKQELTDNVHRERLEI